MTLPAVAVPPIPRTEWIAPRYTWKSVPDEIIHLSREVVYHGRGGLAFDEEGNAILYIRVIPSDVEVYPRLEKIDEVWIVMDVPFLND